MRSGARLLSLVFVGLATAAGTPGCAGNAFSSAGGAAGGTTSAGGSNSGGAGGGSSGGMTSGGGGRGPGLGANRTLDTLSTLERAQLCAELRGLVDANSDSTVYKNWTCTNEAWSKAQMASGDMRATACQNEYELCKTTTTARLSDRVTCMDVITLDKACATVGELRTCYADWAPGIQQLWDQALMGKPQNCVEAVQAGGVDTQVSLTGSVTNPASCVQIVNQCM